MRSTQCRDLSNFYWVSIHSSLCTGKGYGDSSIGSVAFNALEKQAIKMGLDANRPYDYEELIPFDVDIRKFMFVQEKKIAWIVRGMENLSEKITGKK